MPSLSEILNDKIGKGGKSKAYVANALGVGEKTIENYMRGLRSPKPDALIELSKLLKFDLSLLSEQNVRNVTTATETPQNGKEKKPFTEIGHIVNRVKGATRLTIEEIADRIGFTRPHLTWLMYQGKSKKVLHALKTEFSKELQQEDILTTITTKPKFDVTPSNGNGKDQVIFAQTETVRTLADTNKSQQETISKLTDLVTKLVQK